MFNRSKPHHIFSTCRYDSEANRQDYELALNYVVNGELESLTTLLQAKPFLVLFEGLPKNPLITPAGLVIKDKAISLLGCAVGAGDPEMVEVIQLHLLQFKGSEERMEHQLKGYKPCIEAIMTQKPYDLTGLLDVLIKSHPDDVAAELKTGEDYDWDYCSALRKGSSRKGSDLRDALIQFRNDLKPGTLTAPRMHCNYQNLQHAFDVLNREWMKLRTGDGTVKYNYDKNHLMFQQIIGIIQLQELPFYERAAFVRYRVNEILNGQPLKDRSTQIKNEEGKFFPSYRDMDAVLHSNLGFSFSITGSNLFDSYAFNKLCEAKVSRLKDLCCNTQLIKRHVLK